jgi:hypothetical protein
MTGTLRVRRSRGAMSGVLLVLLGLWGALVPLVGPYFHFAYTPDKAWDLTSGRLWMEVLPGAATLLGGFIVLASRLRPAAVLGSWLAAAAGAWFAVGGLVAAHWTSLPSAGAPTGSGTRMVAEQLGFFVGLGVVIAFLAGIGMGRVTVVAHRDVVAAEPEPVTTPASTDADTRDDDTGPHRGLRRLTLGRPLVRSGARSDDDDDD